MISNTPNQLYSCNTTPAYLHTNEQLVDLKNIGQALERYRSSPNDLQTLAFLKEITFIDEEEHKKLTSSDLNTLRSHCPNLNESYFLPLLEYLKLVLEKYQDSNSTAFLERTKKITSIDESDFQKIAKSDLCNLFSLCPNLKIYILLERAKNGGVDFQKIKNAGLDDLFFIYPSIMINSIRICEPYQLSAQSLNSMEYFLALLRSGMSGDLAYRTVDGEKEEQLSIIIRSDNGIEEGKRFKLFFGHLLKPQDFSVYSREEFESLIEANRYFESQDLVEAFTKFLSKPSCSEREKQHLITLIVQTEYGADKNIVGKIIDRLGIQWLQYASELLQDDVEFMQPLIEKHGNLAYQHASKRIRNIQDIAYLAIKKSFESMKYLGDELQNNAEFIESLIKQIDQKGYTIYQYASKTLRSTPNLFYVVMKDEEQIAYNALRYIEPCLADDIEFMTPLIEKYGHQAYRHASKRIRNMADIAHLAIKKSFESMKYLGDELKNEQDFVKSLITIDPFYFSCIGKAAQNNLNIAYDLLHHDKTKDSYLQYIGPGIADNLEFIQAAIQKFGHPVIQYASERIRNMPDLMHIVNESNTDLLQYLGNTLKNDPEFIQSCMEKNLFSFKYGSEEVQNNLEIAKFLLQIQDARVEDMLSYIGPNVKDNLEFMKAAIERFGYPVLEYASEGIRNTSDLMLPIIQQYPKSIEYLGAALKNDPLFITALITINPSYIQYGSDTVRNNFDVAEALIRHTEFTRVHLDQLGPDVRNSEEFTDQIIHRMKDKDLTYGYARKMMQNMAYSIQSGTTNSIEIASSTEIDFHKKCYSLKATIPQEIEYKNKKYTLIRKQEIPYPWIEKIKLIAITFFSLGIALFSKRIREDWSMILDRKKIQILYSMKEEKPIDASIS